MREAKKEKTEIPLSARREKEKTVERTNSKLLLTI